MNPELTRNLWLEVTPHRLLLMPVVILASAALVHVPDPTNTVVRPLALLGFMLFTLVWGARLAANSVLDEARDHTWDIQRMSALSPWTMTCGKLAGATVMAWYGGGWCLAVYLASGQGDDLLPRLATAALATLLAIMAQAGALLGALVGLHRGRRVQARLSNVLVVILLIVVVPRAFSLPEQTAVLTWYGTAFDGLRFALAVAAFYAGWALLGAARAMSAELKVRAWPTCWLAFPLSTALIAAGFMVDSATPSAALARGLCTALTLVALLQTYAAGFAFPGDSIEWRRVLRAATAGDNARALEELPLWPATLALALVAGLGNALLGATPSFNGTRLDELSLGATGLAFSLMALRDLALLSFFSLRRRPRAEATALVYIALLDGLLPGLLPRFGLDGLSGLVLPAFFTAPVQACVIMSVHAAVTVTLAVTAYQSSTAALRRTTA